MGARPAAWSVVFGVISTATLPAAIVATRYSGSYDLLHAGLAIPIAVLAGVAALVLARKARAFDRATLESTGSARSARWGRILGILGLCLAASATISIAVYGVLTSAD